MFNWLGNLFPYSDLHSLNLDWILSKMKETAAQAAKAIADSANALAQVIEAKTAAQDARTAAQNAQTAANNAQTAANNAADSAENAVNVAQQAKSAAQTAQNTANTAQSAAQTAQSTAQTAQSTAETAQSSANDAVVSVAALRKRFPIKNADIAQNAVATSNLSEKSVTISRLAVLTSYLYMDITSNFARFPKGSGGASIDQITAGIVNTSPSFLEHLMSEYIQIRINITDNSGTGESFACSSPIVRCNNKAAVGLIAIAPIIVIKESTNDISNGFIRLSHVNGESGLNIKCEVIFNSSTPFNNDTQFVIIVNAVSAKLSNSI